MISFTAPQCRLDDKPEESIIHDELPNPKFIIDVYVYDVAGTGLQFKVDVGTKVSALKTMIEHATHIPTMCQNLLVGAELMLNDTKVGAYCSQDGLDVTLLLRVDNICKILTEGSTNEKLEALLSLQVLGSKGSEAIDLVIALLGSWHRDVRLASVTTLGRITQKGDELIINSVCAFLEHTDSLVRDAAVAALALVADKGDLQVINGVSVFLEHENEGVRNSAVAALLAQGESHAINAVLASLQHPSWDVKVSAFEALGHMAHDGRELAINALFDLLENRAGGVRRLAVQTMGRVVHKGDERAITAMCVRLKDPSDGVRQAAVDVLCRIASNTQRYKLFADLTLY